MKHIVVDEHLEEMEVHPPGFYQRLADVSIASAKELLEQKERFAEIACPVCASSEREFAFEKNGYSYWDCQTCATLFVSPRPSASHCAR